MAELEQPTGAYLENIVLHDLLVWRDARLERAEVAHWRTVSGAEVDFVVEAGGRLLPIEIKSAARPRLADAAHLRALCEEYGRKARARSCCTQASRLNGSPLMCCGAVVESAVKKLAEVARTRRFALCAQLT